MEKSAKRKIQIEHLQACIDTRNSTIQLMAERLVELGQTYQDLKGLYVPDKCLVRLFLTTKPKQ